MAQPAKIAGCISRPGHQCNLDPLKPNTDKRFRFLKNYRVKSGSTMKFINYKPPRLVKTKDKWYITYTFRVPDQLQNRYKTVWKRFRVYEDINRYKTDSYALELLKSVETELENGYSPFQDILKEEAQSEKSSFNRTLDEFLAYCKHKNLRKRTVGAYNTSVNLLKEYFLKGNVLYMPPDHITQEMMERFLNETALQKKWAEKTYNNYLSDIGTMFQWMVKKKKIQTSPLEGMEFKKTVATKNRYYDDHTASQLKSVIAKEDPALYTFIEFIYYTCTRPQSETRFLQVKHLLFERDLIFIPGHISKNKSDDYVPFDPELKAKLIHLKSEPLNHYVFGINGPSDKPVSQNVFSSRYKKFKDKLKLDTDFTMYGWKHTRVVHLANAGVDPYLIMKLCRHSSLEITMSYMRGLGCEVDWKKYSIDKKF